MERVQSGFLTLPRLYTLYKKVAVVFLSKPSPRPLDTLPPPANTYHTAYRKPVPVLHKRDAHAQQQASSIASARRWHRPARPPDTPVYRHT